MQPGGGEIQHALTRLRASCGPLNDSRRRVLTLAGSHALVQTQNLAGPGSAVDGPGSTRGKSAMVQMQAQSHCQTGCAADAALSQYGLGVWYPAQPDGRCRADAIKSRHM
jgi:hypothetical protein